MSEKKYEFASANKGTVRIDVCGEYVSGCKDVEAFVGGESRLFEEIDLADEVMEWLVSQGVEFESRRSKAFNLKYVQNVMIERDMTEQQLLDGAASWSGEQIDSILYCVEP